MEGNGHKLYTDNIFSLELPEDLTKKTPIAEQYDQKGSYIISKAVIGFSPCRPKVMRDF
jgi:hypothetical protein